MIRQPLGLRTLTTVFLIIWLLAAAFPFAWTVWGSFKVEAGLLSRANPGGSPLKACAPRSKPAAPSQWMAMTALG